MKPKYYICDARNFKAAQPKPDVMPTLTVDQIPRHDFGVGIYGGYWPDGRPVEQPCVRCQKFHDCDHPEYRLSDHRLCFIERDVQR